MKKTLIALFAFIAIGIQAQTLQRFLVVDWDTITVRTVDKISPNMIVNYNYQASSLPIGLDPQLELFVYEGEQSNPVDYRLYSIQNEYYFLDSLDDTWTSNRICGLQSVATYRDSIDLFESIDYVKSEKYAALMPIQQQVEYLLFYIAYIDKVMNSQPIPSNLQNNLVPKFRAVAENWYINYINAENKKDAVRDEQPIDIDSGWTE